MGLMEMRGFEEAGFGVGFVAAGTGARVAAGPDGVAAGRAIASIAAHGPLATNDSPFAAA